MAAVETGHELSLGMMGFNQVVLSRKTHILSKYFTLLTSGTLHAAKCLTSCVGHMSPGLVLWMYVFLDQLTGRVSSCGLGERAG